MKSRKRHPGTISNRRLGKQSQYHLQSHKNEARSFGCKYQNNDHISAHRHGFLVLFGVQAVRNMPWEHEWKCNGCGMLDGEAFGCRGERHFVELESLTVILTRGLRCGVLDSWWAVHGFVLVSCGWDWIQHGASLPCMLCLVFWNQRPTKGLVTTIEYSL